MKPTLDSTSAASDSLDPLLGRLLVVTEKIAADFSKDDGLETAVAAFEEREQLYVQLQQAIAGGAALTPAARVQLDHLRVLDEEILERGTALFEEVRSQRHGLQRRRNVIEAHASKEREEPRLITLKA